MSGNGRQERCDFETIEAGVPIAVVHTSTHLIRFAFHRLSNNPPSIFNPPLSLHHTLLSHPRSKCIQPNRAVLVAALQEHKIVYYFGLPRS